MKIFYIVSVVIISLAIVGFIYCKNNSWDSKLSFVQIGENRTTIEEKMSELLETENTYNIYGGMMNEDKTYKLDDKWEIYITYGNGSPAPWTTERGYDPVDSEVMSFQVRGIE